MVAGRGITGSTGRFPWRSPLLDGGLGLLGRGGKERNRRGRLRDLDWQKSRWHRRRGRIPPEGAATQSHQRLALVLGKIGRR